MADVNFKQALEKAMAADRTFNRLKESNALHKLLPLHGIPFSVKDHLYLKGTHSTFGFARRLEDRKDDEDTPLISILKEAGGIPFVKSNLP
jgi:Asp-tRNA(Asn)/Glu-tRNA(Gln) amidotransferase A subunit family amidase